MTSSRRFAPVPSRLAGEGARRADKGELTAFQRQIGYDKNLAAVTFPSPPAPLLQGERGVRTPWIPRGIGFIAALLVAAIAAAADQPPTDAEHLLYLADHGLAVIRLRIELDGQPQRELCREQLLQLCRQADRDQDGFLTAEDYDRGIASRPVIQDAQNRLMTRPGATPPRPDFSGEPVDVDRVAAFLLRNVWTPLRVEFSSQQMQRINAAGVLQDRPLADAKLFERLDTDGNRKLTGRELERAAVVLGKLDFDEDDIISLSELRIDSTPAATPNAAPNAAARRGDGYLSLLMPNRVDAQFVRRILSLYDGVGKGSAKDLRLDRTECVMAEDLFAQADADENGFWDFDELWRFLERPVPSAEIVLRLSSAGGPTAVELDAKDAAAVRLLHQQGAILQFEIHGVRMQLALPAVWGRNRTADDQMAAFFKERDRDGNDYLDLAEFSQAAEDEAIKAQFRAMDANGNEQVDLAELQASYWLSGQFQDSQCVLGVENLGRTLFGPLDANGDGRLSQRELAGLKARLPEWDADGDGRLIESEIPQQYRLTLSRGGLGNMMAAGGDGDQSARATTQSPLWFRKMDRNRDGEVSLREFLGPAAQFEKIDVNDDGAIDADEAATVK